MKKYIAKREVPCRTASEMYNKFINLKDTLEDPEIKKVLIEKNISISVDGSAFKINMMDQEIGLKIVDSLKDSFIRIKTTKSPVDFEIVVKFKDEAIKFILELDIPWYLRAVIPDSKIQKGIDKAADEFILLL